MTHRRHLVPVLFAGAAVALVACSGASITPAPAVRQALITSGSIASQTPVEIVIPWSSTSKSARSVRIQVWAKGAPSRIYLTRIVNRPIHRSSSDFATQLPAGDEVFSFIAFDRPYGDGNELGGATVAQSLHAGRHTIVQAAFEGYAASLTIDPVDSRIRIVHTTPWGPSPPVYDVIGQAPLTFGVTVKDVDGNVISGSGTPKVAAITDAPSSFHVAGVVGQLNSFTIQAIGPMPSAPHIILAAAGANGTRYSATYELSETPLLFASPGSHAPAHMYSFDTLGDRYPFPANFKGVSNPVGLAIDDAGGTLYIADAASSKILAFDENGNAVKGWSSPSVPGINGIAYSAHSGYIYATTSSGPGSVDVFDPTGARVTLSPGFVGLHAAPVGIAYDPKYRVIAVAETGKPGYVDVYTDEGFPLPADSTTLIDDTRNPFVPFGISASLDSDGDFWVSGDDYSPSGGIDPDPTVALYQPSYCCPAINKLQAQGNTGGHINASEGIGTPLSVAAVPAAVANFYVVQARGPLAGFGCSIAGGGPNAACWGQNPIVKIAGIPGLTAAIPTPRGVSHFTAAVFTQY
jgi:DNA-binding beta-propeller fold protein YncE